MAGKGIEIDIAANSRDFQRGTKDVESALEDVADALDDVTDEAKKAGDKLGKEITDGAKDATRATDRLEASFKDVADASKRETNRASDSMKRNFDEGTDAAKRDLAELKDEAISNASETFSSFDGSITSLADGIQGTLGGVISNIGPAGALAGAAAAIGVGMLTAEFERSQERAEEVRQQVAELAQQIIDAGGDIRNVEMSSTLQTWAMELSGTSEAWDLFGDKGQTNLEAIERGAKLTGISMSDMFDALSGRDQQVAVEVLGDLDDKLAEVNKSLQNLAGARAGGSQRAGELKEEKAALEDTIKVMEERTGVTKDSIANAELMAEATAKITAEDEAAAAALQLRSDAVNTLQGELDAAVGTWGDYYDAETGATDPAQYMAAMQAKIDATNNFNTNVRTLAETTGLTMEEAQAVLDQGVDFAPMLASIVAGGDESMSQYAALIQQIIGGGQEIADGQPLSLHADADTAQAQADLDAAATDRNSGIKAQADTKTADKDLEATASKKRTATITAKADTTAANRDLDSVASKARSASIGASVDLSAAERALNEFVNRSRTATVVVSTVDRSGKPVP